MANMKFRGLDDCDKIIGKRVSFEYHDQIRTGVVKDYSIENRKVVFEILSDMTQGITLCDMFSIVELTDEIIENTNPVKFTTTVIK
tara:strand:+ start:91 stop:348 length:258 start_codon:yes stop_codon:yes gene_type:complete